jgi:hypothetical protein
MISIEKEHGFFGASAKLLENVDPVFYGKLCQPTSGRWG